LTPHAAKFALRTWRATFAAHADRPGAPGRHGTLIKALLDQVMVLDRHAREQDRCLAWHDGELRPVHDDLMDALEAGERGRTRELATLCANVLDLWPALWSFTEHPDIDATNNRAERAIRHAVLWRKTSTGTQTPDGDRFVERILTIRETCRCQDRPLHPYLVDVHNARLTGTPIPTPLTA
jgi:transposase